MELPTRPRTAKPNGRQPHHALSTAFVRNVAQAGRYCDGDGLYLDVQPSGTRSWVQRLVIRGRRRELGLGGFPLVPLKDARAQALANRRLARAGGDPLAERRRLKSMPTFAAAAEAVLAQMRPGWRNPKHGKDWLSSMARFAFPRLGKLPVSEVTSADVVETLRKVWHERPATARRVRQRISTVMEYAVAMDHRDDNPCSRIGPILGPQQDLVRHMRALPHRDVAAVVGDGAGVGRGSRGQAGVRVPRADRREIRRGTWGTVGRDRHDGPRVDRPGHADEGEARAWGAAGPAASNRFSMRRETLSNGQTRSCSQARRGKRFNDMALSGLLRTLEVPAVPHGFRSTFRDWAAEETNHPREVVEAALAHVVQNKVEAAYARSDLFERRRRLMNDWAAYVADTHRPHPPIAEPAEHEVVGSAAL